jgi:acetyl-CoA/propionyl-CoA carboxylase biotin carboxyl carrier protein
MLRAPHGFATRWDGGYESGDEISQFYDNLVGKLIVWGRDRDRAIARAIRALHELVIEGVATTIPADLAILAHPDFAALAHSTKWVEDHLDLSGLPSAPTAPASDDVERIRRDLDVEVDGKRFSVSMWVPDTTAAAGRPRRRPGARGTVGGGSGEVAAPMQGTIVKVLVGPGDIVEAGDAVVVLEAMKMENNVTTDRAGTITEVRVAEGDSVGGGDVVVIVA